LVALLLSPSNAAIVEATGETTPGYHVKYDYSQNDIVDLADYVVWRNNIGPGSLPNEGTGYGFINQHDYDYWRGIFGNRTVYAHKANAAGIAYGFTSPLLQAIDEQQDVVLSSPLATNNPPNAEMSPGSPVGWEKPGPTIPTGTVVDSHYIWFNAPASSVTQPKANYKFDGPIIGIIGGPLTLYPSDTSLGFASCQTNCVSYTDDYSGGFVNETTDLVFRLAPAVLRVEFRGFAGDYVRVVTAANVPLRPGDFDQDYDVDASDYVMWRENNINGPQGYTDWRNNVGYSYTFPGPAGGGDLQLTSVVPEPATTMYIAICGLFSALYRRIRRRKM
jgi:hypothetical protein